MALLDKIHAQIAGLADQGLYRKRVVFKPQGLLQFSSNDYLSLSQEPRVSEAYQEGFKKYPAGSGGSPVICGYHAAHQSVEKAFAELLDVDDCLLFTSGYAANLALVRFLASLNASCLIDKSLHASIYDGLQSSHLAFARYLHNDFDDFTKKLSTSPENTVVLTEGIFSMSGQIAPLKAMSAACLEKEATLIIDEAHAFGILGEQGKGAAALHGLNQENLPLRVIPLGKACAGQGAIIAGQGAWIDALLQKARSYIYSTAPSPALAYGLEQTLELVVSADDRRLKLKRLIQFFKEKIAQSALTWTDSDTPIQQLRLGNAHQALAIGQQLLTLGIQCLPMRYPTVSAADTGLRIILNYHHQPEDIQALFRHLEQIMP